MTLNAIGWTNEEDENLTDLVRPHPQLYYFVDPSRKDILVRNSTWQEIAQALGKPVEECKKRWRGLRDGYMKSRRMGALHKTNLKIFEKLHFLEGSEELHPQKTSKLYFKGVEELLEVTQSCNMEESEQQREDEESTTEQQVITDNQEYYEITVVDTPQEQEMKPVIKLLPKPDSNPNEPPKKVGRKNSGRKKSIPMPRNIPPIKILPKPIILNGPKIVRYVEDSKTPEQRSQVMDKLMEKILKENTNEIDVFFKSMAASVKKLQPNLIPKVKMEVCNVIAKYEMQSFDKNQHNY